jgi:allantoinase
VDAAPDLAITGTALLDGHLRPATVLVRGGRVVEARPPDPDVDATERIVLADDEVLLPGLVDTHVHVNEPGRTAWEGFATATRAAAAGGVTTIVDMPLNSVPATTDVAALQAKRLAATGQCHVDVAFWGGAVPSSLGHLAELHEAGVLGFKCFLVDSGVPEFPPLSWEQLDTALAEVSAFDGLLIVHAEDAEVLAEAPECAGPSYPAFVASRPPEAEQAAITGLLLQAGRYDARVHVLHLSGAAAVPRLRRARQAGLRVSVETCPHYLTLSADHIADGHTEFKCCPPIRDGANQDRLWEALAEGVIDCVVSDHSPATPDLKCLDSGDFGAAWGGIASVQLGLPAMWTAARERGVGLPDVVRWMSTAPAALAGLPGKGAIAPGNHADLVVFAPDQAFVVDPARLQHRHPVTPYAGRELTGAVRRVWLGGQTVVSDGEPVGAPLGRLLRRQG